MAERSYRGDRVDLVVDTETMAARLVNPETGRGWLLGGLPADGAGGPRVVDARDGDGGVVAEVRLGGNGYRLGILLDEAAAEVVVELAPVAEPAAVGPIPFPTSLAPTAGTLDELALPLKLTNGVLHRPRAAEEWSLDLDVAGSNGLVMPFWAVTAGGTGLLAVLETPDDVVLRIDKRAGERLGTTPHWLPSRGRLGHPRRLRLRLLERPGYVPAAAAYRRYVMGLGRFKSLAEKIEDRPVVRQLVGGPYFFTGYLPFSERKFRQVLGGLRGLGYDNGLVGPVDFLQWGAPPWLNDYQPFISSPEFGRLAADAGFAAFAWLYLEDILTWDPYFDEDWLVRGPDGETREGWFNRDYEYRQLCSAVLRDKGRLLRHRITSFDALHFDTTTSKSLVECYDPRHPATRADDRENRRAWLAEVASWGRLIGSEAGYDWAFDVLDFCSSNPRRDLETRLPVPAVHVPLLGLVYHDSVISYCWEYDPYNPSYFGGDWSRRKLLFDLMAGNPPTVSPVQGYFPVIARPAPPVESRWVTWEDPTTQRLLREALVAARLHGHTAHQQLVDHRFVDGRDDLTQTRYADGTGVTVNTSAEPVVVDGETVPSAGYLVDGPGGSLLGTDRAGTA